MSEREEFEKWWASLEHEYTCYGDECHKRIIRYFNK